MLNIKYSFLLFLCPIFWITPVLARNHLPLPANDLHYICKCASPSAQGLCHAYQKNGYTVSTKAKPIAKILPNGWMIQPINCVNKQKYTLTFGAVFFSGKKIFALYDKLSPPHSMKGYVYHVYPNLPFSQKNDSVTLIQNSNIQNIDLNQGQWECSQVNKPTACNKYYLTARCISENGCFFE